MALDEKTQRVAIDAGHQAINAGLTNPDGRNQPPPPAPTSTGSGSQRGPHNDLAGQAGQDKADAWNKGEDIQHKRSPGMDQALDKVKADPALNKTLNSLRQTDQDWLKSGKDSAMNAGEKASVRSTDGESRFHQSHSQTRQQEQARGR